MATRREAIVALRGEAASRSRKGALAATDETKSAPVKAAKLERPARSRAFRRIAFQPQARQHEPGQSHYAQLPPGC
jgi:hypothetical protein